MRPAIDPDYGWHVVNGQHVFDGKVFGGRDIYSWTATNVWVAHEWATEAIMSVLHSNFGPTANSIVAAIIGCATYTIVTLRLRKRLFGWSTILIALPIVFVGSMRSIGVRPLVLELLYLSLVIAGIDAYVGGRFTRRRALILIVAGGSLWVNTHGSFILLPVVLWITAAELFLTRDQKWRDFAISGAIACAAGLLNPWGFRMFVFAVQSISSQPTLAYIDEWKRPVLTDALAIPLLLQSALAVIGMWRVRSSTGSYAGILRTFAFGYLAFSSGRHIMLFGIAAAEFIAASIQPLAIRISASVRKASSDDSRDARKTIVNLVAAVASVAMIVKAGWREISPDEQRRSIAAQYPVQLPLSTSIKPSDRLFNEYRLGGFLIMNDVLPVFIDGRSELYGDDQLRRYASITNLEDGWQEKISALGITKVLMSKNAKLAKELARHGWSVTAEDSVGVLLTRRKQIR